MAASSQQPGNFKVDRLPLVTRQIRHLVEKAKSRGMARQLLDALEAVVEKLKTAPFEWGDPEYRTNHPGGMVLHGLHAQLFVRYVAYEKERLVCMLSIRVLPGHPLENA